MQPVATADPIEPRRSGDVSFLRFVWVWNLAQGRHTPELHTRVARWLGDGWERGDRRMLLMVFRDAGKSTLVGLFCAWLLSRDPSLRILVVAAEHQLATKMSRNIRSVLEMHELTSHVRPMIGNSWASDQFTVERPLVLRDPSVLARGIGSNLTGSRADIIICDDVEVPNTADGVAKRMALRERLNELRFVLVPDGLQLYIGTPHTYYSIYAETAREDRGEALPFLHGYERLRLPAIDDAGNSAWPERFPTAELRAIRNEVGPERFRSQMMLQPTRPERARLDPDRLIRYEEELEIVGPIGVSGVSIGGEPMVGACCWWDPAYGRPDGGDGSVVTCVFGDRQGRYWLHDIEYLSFDPGLLGEIDEATQLCRRAIAFASRNAQRAITVETNGLGRFLPGLLRREVARSRSRLTIREHNATRSKASRILDAFDPVLASGHLRAHARVWSTPFIEEMREWSPIGRSKDDGLDAVSAALANQPVRLGRNDHDRNLGLRRRFGSEFMAETRFRPL